MSIPQTNFLGIGEFKQFPIFFFSKKQKKCKNNSSLNVSEIWHIVP